MHPDTLRISPPSFPIPVCRLGLATRGNGRLAATDVHRAIESGVNFLNWCGHVDGLSRAIGELGSRRDQVMVCVQFEARTAPDARVELEQILRELRTDFVDALTFYYVEAAAEWAEIIGPGGAFKYCQGAQREGKVRLLGATSHQRPLAAEMARSGLLDLLMVRYNAAHRGAERDIFPATRERGLPVVAFTCLRWGALLQGTPDDPPGFVVPRAPDWYRFVLREPAVTVALMAPADRIELEENLGVLRAGDPLGELPIDAMAQHGQRVRRHAGGFP